MTSAVALGQLTHDDIHSLEENFLNAFFNECQKQFGEESFSKWLNKLEIFSQSSGEVIFSAPSKFIRDWIIREFVEPKNRTNLLSVTQILRPQVKKVSVIYVVKSEKQNAVSDSSSDQKVVSISKHENVFAFGTELNPRYTFKNFVSAKYNRLACSMAKMVAGVEGQIDLFNEAIPLFIHGNIGMGKTHLAQAIAWQIKEKDKSKKVVYLSAEKFMYHFVQSVRGNATMDFKEKMRTIDVLIVDDVQFIAGKEGTQQEFMNSFNRLVEENKQVVLVCDRCPSDLENIDEKLKSRISGGMIVNFKNPDYQDRVAILKEKSKMHEQEICDKVISFLAEKITTNVRDLEGALRKLIAGKILNGDEITLENAKEVLTDYIRASNSTAPTIQKVQKAVAAFYEIKIADLSSSNRTKAIVRPRQIAMYLSKTLTSLSLPKIGQEFGGKNHATVIHSVKLVQELMNADQVILQEVKSLEEKIRNS